MQKKKGKKREIKLNEKDGSSYLYFTLSSFNLIGNAGKTTSKALEELHFNKGRLKLNIDIFNR